MRLGRILYPIQALGPGERLGIWLQGCEKRCEGCANPELQPLDKPEIPYEMFLAMCRSALTSYGLDSISVSGGEPFLQAGELNRLLRDLKPLLKDVLVFTGYTLEELQSRKDPETEELLGRIDVLVDGPYIRERNRGELLRGSDNQCIRIFSHDLREKYENYLSSDRHLIDSFYAHDGVVVVGIHPDGTF